MRLFLEGPDGVGKSTLAQQLHEITGDEIHYFNTKPATTEEVYERVDYYVQNKGIYDRCVLVSEPVYGMVLRGKSLIGSKEVMERLMWLNKIVKPVFIFLWSPNDTFSTLGTKAWKSKEHVESVQQNRDRILAMYDNMIKLMASCDCKMVMYNWHEQDAMDLYAGLRNNMFI